MSYAVRAHAGSNKLIVKHVFKPGAVLEGAELRAAGFAGKIVSPDVSCVPTANPSEWNVCLAEGDLETPGEYSLVLHFSHSVVDDWSESVPVSVLVDPARL